MKNRHHRILPLIIGIVFLVSCNDIIDRDLSVTNVKVNYPSDSFVAYNYTILFSWEQLDGVSGYRVQIAQPNFSSIQQMFLDTLITSTKFSYMLFPGIYQWRIRAENGTSSSQFITRVIVIDSNSNLNGQSFNPIAPIDGYTSNNSSVAYSWAKFPFAHKYEYVLMDTSEHVIRSIITPKISFTDIISEGKYLWKARALDTVNLTSTLYSLPRMLIIDTTKPTASSPATPSNNANVTNAVTLTWTKGIEVVGDSLQVAIDSLFNTKVLNTYFSSSSSFILPALTTGNDYFWRLRSRDSATNWSLYSVTYKFHLN